MNSINKADIDKILGDTFKEYRLKSKLTQEKVAERLGISVKYISRIENGTGGVKVETLVNYMNILCISPNIIFDKLIINENLRLQLRLSNRISNLPNEKVNFVNSVIDLLEDL